MKEIPKPAGRTPVASWAVLCPGLGLIGGFASSESARTWAQEWLHDTEHCAVLPVVDSVKATAALAAFEAHRQRNEENGDHWRKGAPRIGHPNEEGEEWRH